MAIQSRRGNYADFDPAKLLPGEWAVVQGGDTSAADGKSVYMAFSSGDVKRMATYEDMVENISEATEDIAQDVAEQIEENLQSMVQTAQTAAQTATTKANEASQSASSVSASAAQIATNASDISDLKEATESLEDQMTQKADIDGAYEDLTVGTAEAVLSEKFTADSVPYHFRKTPFGDRLKEKIIGGTVAWNQLLKSDRIDGNYSGLTASIDADGTINIVGTNGGDSSVNYTITLSNGSWGRDVPANHKLLYRATNYNGFRWERAGFATNNRKQAFVHTTTISYSATVRIFVEAGETVDIHSRFNYFDLTQMFGPAIADHIYTLEQTTAGLGVALFRKLFPKQYYPHNPGELLSVSGLVSHDEIGFNQWDEETITGYYQGSNGQYASASNQLCTKNYIPVLPDTQYCFGKSYNLGDVLLYDENKNFIRADINRPAYYVFTTPTNCHFINLNLGSTYGATYKNDICINLSDPEKNGQYEPYKKHSYPLDSSLTLRGIPKLVDNKIKFDGDVYESDGKITRRYGIVDLGTLSWNYDSSGSTFSAVISGLAKNAYTSPNLVCSKYPTTPLPTSQFTYGIRYNGGSSSVMVKDSVYTDAATFKTAMSGVMLVYELATPTEESAQPYANPQRCFEGGTEEYVTTGIVPVGHESEYYENIATKVDGLPYDLSMIAPIENGTTASRAYSVGQYFLHNDQFCKAKTAIASGATFTLNTNYEVTTVANELYTALH